MHCALDKGQIKCASINSYTTIKSTDVIIDVISLDIRERTTNRSLCNAYSIGNYFLNINASHICILYTSSFIKANVL